VTATEQPSQLIPAIQKTWTSVSGPSSLPPIPPIPDGCSAPKTLPAWGAFWTATPFPVSTPLDAG